MEYFIISVGLFIWIISRLLTNILSRQPGVTNLLFVQICYKLPVYNQQDLGEMGRFYNIFSILKCYFNYLPFFFHRKMLNEFSHYWNKQTFKNNSIFSIFFELLIHDRISNIPSCFRPFDLSKWWYEERPRTTKKGNSKHFFFNLLLEIK